MTELQKLARAAGFEHVGDLKPGTIRLLPQVRQMCAENSCGRYGRRWSCPPGCGELDVLQKQIAEYEWGILVQSTTRLEDEFDIETMMEAERVHKKRFEALYDVLRKQYGQVLALGAGCCTKCRECTYPDAPCRFPDAMTASMEAYGILVSQVCKDNDLEYFYGRETITYTSCFLIKGE